MPLFLLGCTAGFLLSGSLLIVFEITGQKFTASDVTNTVIAFATVVATVMHCWSLWTQRKDRLWDINKPVLLDLTHSLSQVIKAFQYYLHEEYAKSNDVDDGPDATDKPADDVFKAFEKNQEYALTVYRTLMDKELIRSLEESKNINDDISKKVREDVIDIRDAYEEGIENYGKLRTKLDRFIAKISGIKKM